MPVRLFIANPARREAVVTGPGFALAFGWLWYGPLRDAWLADTLTGTLFSGRGATAFFTALALTLLCGGLGAGKLGDSFAGQRRGAILAHGAALSATLCAALLSFFGGASPGWPGILAGAALGFAGGIGGAYWTAALLRLTSPAAAWALGIAALTAAGLYGLGAVVAPSVLTALPPACVLAALLLSLFPVRPPQNPAESSAPEQTTPLAEETPKPTKFLFLLAAFFALGVLLSALDSQNTPPSWAQCPLEGAGALAAGLFCAACLKRPETTEETPLRFWHWPFAATLLLPLALLAFSPRPQLFGVGLLFCSGLAQGLAVAFLALQVRKAGRNALRAACFSLLGLLVIINAGFYAGARAALMWNTGYLGLAVLVLPCIGLLFLLPWHARRKVRLATEAEKSITESQSLNGTAAPESTPTRETDPQLLFTAWELTPREKAVAALVRSGLSNPEIANSAGISENTVRIHLKNLYRKSGCSSREELLEKLGS